MLNKDLIIKKARHIDTRKYTTISIRVTEATKKAWAQFCKENKISQQATFETILNYIMEDN